MKDETELDCGREGASPLTLSNSKATINHMKAHRVPLRDTSIPGRKIGHISVWMRWNGGGCSRTCYSWQSVRAVFERYASLLDANGTISIKVRKQNGKLETREIARWTGDENLSRFLELAKQTYDQIPGENSFHPAPPPVDIPDSRP
jgi:hypothetical protein